MSNLADAMPINAALHAALSDRRQIDGNDARALYFALNKGMPKGAPDADSGAAARAYLDRQLDHARTLPSDMPQNPAALMDWMTGRAHQVGLQYHAYLQGRRDGAPRRYFSNRSHALYFLQNVAPTKLVDGAWLFGLLTRWDDPDFRPLIQTYLEELGDGVPEKNHVVLYKKLLASEECDQWQDLPQEQFIQGAIQLALAYNAEHFLPEIIGFNLGYEQLPLHLLITAYELNELGIDPYYFTLHVTVDNGSTGHACKAVQALQQLMPQGLDAEVFMRRVQDGYRLNDLGAGTTSVIEGFDLQEELVRILAAKAVAGQNMHSDYCRVAGRSINDWLSTPQQIPSMLAELEKAGWIQRGEPAENSRFWRLIQSERAEMSGVFSAYEQQVLKDWITAVPGTDGKPAAAPRTLSYRARQRSLDTFGLQQAPRSQHGPRSIIRRHQHDNHGALRQLEQRIAARGSKEAAMALLQSLMTPAGHHSASGLMATRMFRQLLG